MFWTRLISGVFLLAAVIGLIFSGGLPLELVLAFISIVGAREMERALGQQEPLLFAGGKFKGGIVKGQPQAVFGNIMILGTVLYYVLIWIDFGFAILGIMIFLIAILAAYVFTYPRYHVEQVMGEIFTFLYVPVSLSFIFALRHLKADTGGRALAALVFLCSWGCDTCAYCVGKLIGKHKMTPVLSPKKSVEGAVGGVLGAGILGFFFARLVSAPQLEYALICMGGALISMVGDLAASAIKRNKDIKDYGNVIPGHGGILDRFDSVIITAPLIYCLAKFML